MEPFFPFKTEESFSAPHKLLINDFNHQLGFYKEELKAFETSRQALVKREKDLEALRNAIEMVEE